MSEQQAPPRPAAKEVISVTCEGVGEKKDTDVSEEKYKAIALQCGFFDPRQEGSGYRPELGIATLPAPARAKVNEILSGK